MNSCDSFVNIVFIKKFIVLFVDDFMLVVGYIIVFK